MNQTTSLLCIPNKVQDSRNVRHFDRVAEQLEGQPAVEPHKGLPAWAYGERRTPGSHMAPIFNPLHPTVQEAILRFVGEIGRKYGPYPSFRGVSFNMFASCMPWFGSLHAGYDDTTARLFHEETGIDALVGSTEPGRFAGRYEHLNFTCRKAWVGWRCRKIRELFGRIHEALNGVRDDLNVKVTLWDETTVPGVLGQPSAALQYGARPSMLELFREGGIDPVLYHDCPGLEIDLGIGNPRDRGGHGDEPCGGVQAPLESMTMYRDYDYLDRACLEAIHGLDRPGAFIFNCWVEAWGRHVWFAPEEGDPNVAEVSVMDGKPADGVVRMNSEYPEDGFWWDSQLRITPPFPSGAHFLEPYAHAVAELDACRISRGGLFLDKAHGELIRRFARAYRALPNQKFEQVGETTDPVAVRTLVQGGLRYLYAVNRDYYPVDLTVMFDRAPAALRDLADGAPLERPAFQLGPYELRSFSLEAEVSVTGFAAVPPAGIVEALLEDAKEALAEFEAVRQAGRHLPGMEELEVRMRDAVAEGRLAFLRRALTSYLCRKARALVQTVW